VSGAKAFGSALLIPAARRARLVGMKREFVPERLDVAAFAAEAAALSADDPVPNYPRLVQELALPAPDAVVSWEAVGEQRTGALGKVEPWLLRHAAPGKVPSVLMLDAPRPAFVVENRSDKI